MLTEDRLRELVESAAGSAPEPSPLPDGLFAIEPSRPRRRRRWQISPAPVFGVLAAIAVSFFIGLCFISLTSSGSDTKSSSTAAGSFSPVANSIGDATRTEAPATTVPGAGGAGGSTASGSAAATGSIAAQVPPVGDTAKVIKTGALEVQVGKGTVTESVNRLTALATGFGGYLSDTRTTANPSSGSQATAVISVRVPSGAFEQLLTEVSKLGEVRSTTTSGQDVTAQFTDIDAQLTALNATRDQLLLVLGEAKVVPDILAVQDRITQIQIQIDQLQGQKRLLTDQTSFGTLSVTFLEPGATAAAPPPPDDGRDLGDAWGEARDHFVDGVESIVAASGTLALLALCAGAAWFVYRSLRRRALTM